MRAAVSYFSKSGESQFENTLVKPEDPVFFEDLIKGVLANPNNDELDLGVIGDRHLSQFNAFLEGNHPFKHISIKEDEKDKWSANNKQKFVDVLRSNPTNAKILSVSVYFNDVHEHFRFLADISIITRKNREEFKSDSTNNFRVQELNAEQPCYFEEDLHSENSLKFSVKTYISNIFQFFLDEGMFNLEKDRMNFLRDGELSQLKQEPEEIIKFCQGNLLTADGSILYLAKYLLSKLDKENL